MDLRITGKVAVVTGAGKGIGRAITRRLAAEGARVVVADLDGAAADGVVEEVLSDSGSGLAIQVDVTDEAAVT